MERNYLKKQPKALALLLMSLIVMLMISLMFTSMASANVNVITDAAYINITAEEAKQMVDKNQSIVILDVRSFAEYKSGYIEGAESLPLSTRECGTCLRAFLDKNEDNALLVYCRSGIKSADACNILVNHGYEKVYKMIGGLNAWADAGFPVVSDSNDSFSSEIDDILSSNKSVFRFFYVDGCHFCQQQIPIIDELEQEYKEQIAFIRINCEDHPNAMKEFGAGGYPPMFLIMGKGDDGQYESQYFSGFTDRETLKKNVDYVLKTESINEDSSISILSYDECETNPSQCQCRFTTCLGGCLNIDPVTIAGCAGTCGACYAAPHWTTCGPCAVCLGAGTSALINCIAVSCSVDPCAYGYVCRPCNIKSPLNRRCTDSDTYEVEICRCDGQGWGNWRRKDCPSGKSCCDPGGLCVNLQTDPNNCGRCNRVCPEHKPVCEDGKCVKKCTPGDIREYYKDCGKEEVLEEIENTCDCTCLYYYYTYKLQCLVTERCNDKGKWEKISEGPPERDGIIKIKVKDKQCDIVEDEDCVLDYYFYLPPPDVPENCEVTGVEIVEIPDVIIDYCDGPYWVNCGTETYCYYYEEGSLKASGNLKCYCENTEEWEDRGTYTWYGDYYINELCTYWEYFVCPDLSSALQTLSDTHDEEPLSIMSTDNECFTSQTDGRNEGSQSRNIDIDISSHIFPYDSATHDIVIDPTVSRALFMIYWSEMESNLNLTINTPSGIVEPSVASTDPSIGYKENTFSKYYRINTPEPGNWSMNITAVSVPTNGLDYNVIMNLVIEIPITLSISTNKDKYNPNEQAIITSNLKYNNTPLIGASIVTDILRPDGTVDKLLLFDDGSHGDIQANDGNYSNTYTNTTINGTYDIIITASGTTPDGDFFNRKKSLPITVATLTAKFNDKYSDYGTDKYGDGLYDYLTIDVGVNVTVAGNYTLIGILSDAEGNNIATAFNHTYLEIGDKAVKLNCDGTELQKHGVDGPYHLKRLILSSVDYMTDVYVTKSYNCTDFQTKLAEFSGTYSDYGTDIDGDGLYDYLTIDVGVNITTEGDYTLNGRLYDVNGKDIAWAINTTHLDIGTQIIQLNFDGKSIHKHGVNGPYYLKYLQIPDKARKQSESVFDACTTSAYNYRDFQKPLAVFTGAYTDYEIDTDGDGLYDYLTIDVGVNVITAGNYSLMGYLYDATGTEIVWSIVYGSLDVGNHTMHLDFEGKTIETHGVNGPYYLKDLLLSSGKNWTFIDSIPEAYTTSAYDYSDFGGLYWTIVEIDIMPDSYPNSISLESKGEVPVAVLSNGDFDASTVDTSTVVFTGAEPVKWTMKDVAGDGDIDMLFHFMTQELNLDENSTVAMLTGDTTGGKHIKGSDSVHIVPKGKSNGL